MTEQVPTGTPLLSERSLREIDARRLAGTIPGDMPALLAEIRRLRRAMVMLPEPLQSGRCIWCAARRDLHELHARPCPYERHRCALVGERDE